MMQPPGLLQQQPCHCQTQAKIVSAVASVRLTAAQKWRSPGRSPLAEQQTTQQACLTTAQWTWCEPEAGPPSEGQTLTAARLLRCWTAPAATATTVMWTQSSATIPTAAAQAQLTATHQVPTMCAVAFAVHPVGGDLGIATLYRPCPPGLPCL
jgi:hypothetical protein